MGENPNDFRLGPWRAANWLILDDTLYRAGGQVLYFLTDSHGRVRYIGESKNRLRTRWRTPPLAGPADGRPGEHIFHNVAWPKIEEALLHDPACAPFHVSAIPLSDLHALVERHPDLRAFIEGATKGAESAKHLSWHIETWLCEQPALRQTLWNVAKRGPKAPGPH